MKFRQIPPLTLSAIFCVALVSVAIVYGLVDRAQTTEQFSVDSVLPPPITQPAAQNKVVSADELRLNDGKQGRRCYVAIDSSVYEIKQGLLWNNGQHDSSNGSAYCGADLTEALKSAPHGREKLESATMIGRYQP